MWGAKRSAEEAALAQARADLARVTDELSKAEAARAFWEQELTAANAECRRLIDIIIDLKREGFVPPTRPEQLVAVEPGIPDDVEMAIRQRSGPGTDLERDLRQWAAQQLRNGAQPENVIHAVIQGSEEDE